MNHQNITELLDFDRHHLWHPYTSMRDPLPVYPVESASGVTITLQDGRKLLDGMSSWWAAIHGYNHPALNHAIEEQLKKMAHIMFGGLTHTPAVELAKKLIELTPPSLEKVFFADSGSVSVEVAIKMALQYQQSIGQTQRNRLLTVRSGYHGDTFGAMALCDPVSGMHSLFQHVLAEHLFVPSPRIAFGAPWDEHELDELKAQIKEHRRSIAAVILEPVVQGAGGMKFYSPHYLKRLREICDENDILLIFDEIATGWGRTGRLFAMDHAGIAPDIVCFGKALTGGYMTLAAVMTNSRVADGISSGNTPQLMHGPTFMANPLACSVALASINLLLSYDWKKKLDTMQRIMEQSLEAAKDLPTVANVRILGGIGVIETKTPVDMARMQKSFVEKGVWIRPFGKLVYIMPPYIIEEKELQYLAETMVQVVKETQEDSY